jgi:hypothetical protein
MNCLDETSNWFNVWINVIPNELWRMEITRLVEDSDVDET